MQKKNKNQKEKRREKGKERCTCIRKTIKCKRSEIKKRVSDCQSVFETELNEWINFNWIFNARFSVAFFFQHNVYRLINVSVKEGKNKETEWNELTVKKKKLYI